MPHILGVRIDNLTWKEADQKVRSFLNNEGQYKIFTPNPEMLVLAKEIPVFKNVLNGGDLNLCDGFGVSLVSREKIKRIPGVDFVWKLCGIAAEEKSGIFLLGTSDVEILKESAAVLKDRIFCLEIKGLYSDLEVKIENGKIEVEEEKNKVVLEKIKESGAKILVVAFGQLKQEFWISEYLKYLPNVKIAIGVGGALDFISGYCPRAPFWMRKIGLEWLFRLYKEPHRLRRIYRAIFKFIYYSIRFKNN